MNLELVAFRQRLLLALILAHIASYVCALALPVGTAKTSAIVAMFVIAVAAIVVVVLLAASLRWSIVAIVFTAILVLIPLIGLLVLLRVNGAATKVLRAGGYRVGLMGARSR